jgi:hypothetical protein
MGIFRETETVFYEGAEIFPKESVIKKNDLYIDHSLRKAGTSERLAP